MCSLPPLYLPTMCSCSSAPNGLVEQSVTTLLFEFVCPHQKLFTIPCINSDPATQTLSISIQSTPQSVSYFQICMFMVHLQQIQLYRVHLVVKLQIEADNLGQDPQCLSTGKPTIHMILNFTITILFLKYFSYHMPCIQ